MSEKDEVAEAGGVTEVRHVLPVIMGWHHERHFTVTETLTRTLAIVHVGLN